MRFYVSERGLLVSRSFLAVLVWSVSLVLAVSMLSGQPAYAEDPVEVEDAPARVDSDGDGTADRPDLVAAAVAARLLGEPVEDLSQRTESVQVLVNPDGSLTQESSGAPVRVQDDQDRWHEVDYTLVEQSDGSYAPRWAVADVTVGGGGSTEVATVKFADGGSAALSWPEELPEPQIEDSVATFEISETADLLVIMTARGVVTHIRLNEAPAQGEDASFPLGLTVDGVKVSDTADGRLAFTREGEKVETTSRMVAWDAKLDEAGDPVDVVPVEVEMSAGAKAGDGTEHELELSAPAQFLSDPGTEYPVVIDPDIAAVQFSADTWVRSGTTTPYGDDYRLLVGRIASHSNQNHTMSMLRWGNAELSGKKIVSAELSLFQYHSGSCKPRTMNIHPLAGSFSETSTTWSNRPGLAGGTGASAALSQNVGGDGCAPNGRVSADVKRLVQGWADGPSNGGFSNHGMQLNVPGANASDKTYERRFCSSEILTSHTTCKNSSVVPTLTVRYNGPPDTAGVPAIAAGRTFDGLLYAQSTKPRLSAVATDPESSRLTYELEVRTSETAAANASSCVTSLVAAGETAECEVATALAEGQEYVMRARAVDEYAVAGAWSPWRAFGIDTTDPTSTSIACGSYEHDRWYEDAPSERLTCDLSSGAGVVDFEWRRPAAGTVEDQPALPATDNAATTPEIAVPSSGVVTVQARGRTKSGKASPWKTFSFGVGSAALTEPLRDDRSTSRFPVRASAVPGATSATLQWRYAPDDEGDTTTGWADVTASTVKVAATGDTWDGSLSTGAGDGTSQTPRLLWDPSQETGIVNPSSIQVQVVFAYGEGVTKRSPFQRVQLVPHAFGGSFPTQDAGPGQVALFTGEFQVSATDVTMPGRGDDLTFSRSHATLAGEQPGPVGVLGPGWVADFAGAEAGVAGFQVIDNTAIDGTFVLMSPEGESYVYAHSTGTKGARQLGTYKGVGETKLEEDSLVLTSGGGTGITHTLTLTEWDGTVTEFKRTVDGSTGIWSPAKTTEATEASTTSYVRDGQGLITWIVAPAPTGVTCTTLNDLANKGCRGLKFTYATIDGRKRLTKIEYKAWDPNPGATGAPGTGSAGTRNVAMFDYDAQGRLATSWTPLSAGDTSASNDHTTTYTYATVGSREVVSTITPPGQAAWEFDYDSSARISTIKRQQPTGVGTGKATWTIAYGVPLDGSGVPAMQTADVGTWGQLPADAPTGATAVFEPDHVPAASPTGSDWQHASLSYFTRAGRTTNTASYGAGAWQIDSTRYDAHGNTVWDLDAAGRLKALSEPDTAAAADKYATITVYNPTGTRVENVYSPMRDVVLEDGTRVTARTVTATDYDDEAAASLMPGRPTTDVPAEGFGLPVEERTAVTDKIRPSAEGQVWDTQTVRYRYDPVTSGDGSGWVLKTPTLTIENPGSGESVTTTRFDAEGRTIESSTPGAGTTTNTPRTTKTAYYTADNSSPVSACRAKPEWDGWTCQTSPGGAPSAGAAVPTETIAGYSIHGTATRTLETSGSTTRTVSSVLDYVGRATSESTTLGSETMSSTTAYATSTGLVTQSAGNGKTETYGYDSWGRQTSYTDGVGSTASTTYDTSGRVKTANDGKATTTYTYDGTDAAGKTERRGLVTKVDTGFDAGSGDVFTAAYDADGNIIRQGLPGGYETRWTRDVTGADTGLSYAKGGTEIMAFSTVNDHEGRTRVAYGPDGNQQYTYDDRDRLTQVKDTHRSACTTRAYEFSADSNRTRYREWAPTASGACQSSTTAVDVSASYDTADRVTTTGYAYDALGRTTTVPKADTNVATDTGASNLTVGYHANDMVKTLSQSVSEDDATSTVATQQSFTLDASDRVSVITEATGGVELARTTNHYDSGEDSPAWSRVSTRPDANTAWADLDVRNVPGIDGDLAIQTSAESTILNLANPHGDVVMTIDLAEDIPSAYADYTEYGLPRASTTEHTDRYGWLGAKTRHSAGITAGLTLMGVRLYNPTTGRFLSTDPVAGGNDNTYVYPGDPVNELDLDGRFKIKWRTVGKWAARGAALAGGVACGASVVCAVGVTAAAGAAHYAAGHARKKGKHRFRWGGMATTSLRWGAGGALKARTKFISGRMWHKAIRGGKVSHVGKRRVNFGKLRAGGGRYRGSKVRFLSRQWRSMAWRR